LRSKERAFKREKAVLADRKRGQKKGSKKEAKEEKKT